ncbi:DNA binding protein [Penicillium canariense]|uniref:DNA binding protein n=1 Tax=Penicillium canariense TaxID=189055 RepID=A0A9W9LRY0_9EURO|nr:DNA binding protein [Penicillium canariense]KAJ5174321.1 DNA binding protein [Penicillium canariense]
MRGDQCGVAEGGAARDGMESALLGFSLIDGTNGADFLELLPADCFGARNFPTDLTDEKFCYQEHFLKGSFTPDPNYSPQCVHMDRIMVMERDKDERMNAILNLLEHGIFEALMTRRLQGVQIAICKSQDGRTNVFETYTISLDYNGNRGPPDRKLAGKESWQSSLEARKGIMRMLHKITVLADERTLGFHLLYTPDCPEVYQSHGFAETYDERISYPRLPSWTRTTVTCGGIDTGSYTATLKVTYLTPPIPLGVDSVAMPESTAQRCDDRRSRFVDLGFL